MTRLAVLITCYNRVEKTLCCLRALRDQDGLGSKFLLDVFLVDDASTDGTASKVRSEFSDDGPLRVNVIESHGNLFWCKGMRLAWDKAVESEKTAGQNYNFFLWLNDDVHLKEDAIENVLGDCEMVGGVIVGTFAADGKYSEVCYSAKRFDGFRPIPDGRESVKIERGYLNGNLLLVPHGIYEKIGPIYDGYSHGFGDYDYGMMLSRAGLGFYSSSHYCGWCECEESRVRDMRGATLCERLAMLRNPRGRPLRDTFIYRYRHWGLWRAVASSVHVIYLALFGETGFQ